MSAQDHNKTLVALHAAIGGVYTGGLIAGGWLIAKNLKSVEQSPASLAIVGIVFLLALLFWSSAILMHRRKPAGRPLALIAAPFCLIGFWPVTIYTWWFMHSDGAKRMYNVVEDT